MKIPRLGFLGATSSDAVSKRVEAFQQGLSDLGWVEQKNIVTEYRWAEGHDDRLPDLAAELVRLKVDIIVSAGPKQTPHLKKLTSSIPIVMAFDNDPVGNGFVKSLARPGGNITGLSTLAPDIVQKRLEFLKKTVPRLSRVAILRNSSEPGDDQMLRETIKAATQLKVMLQYLDILNANHIKRAFENAQDGRAQAVLALTNPIATQRRSEIIDLTVKNRLPAIYDRAEFVVDGGLMSYGVSSTELFRRAASYVDKILKGRKPADLPVEQPTRFELVINLKAAKQIGIMIPQRVLFWADNVIK